MDSTPPATIVGVGIPKYAGARLYVTSATPVSLAAIDGGATPVGLASLEYRIDGGAWVASGPPISISGADGPHSVAYRVADLLGNAGAGAFDVTLYNTPPVTTLAPAAGPYTEDMRFAL